MQITVSPTFSGKPGHCLLFLGDGCSDHIFPLRKVEWSLCGGIGHLMHFVLPTVSPNFVQMGKCVFWCLLVILIPYHVMNMYLDVYNELNVGVALPNRILMSKSHAQSMMIDDEILWMTGNEVMGQKPLWMGSVFLWKRLRRISSLFLPCEVQGDSPNGCLTKTRPSRNLQLDFSISRTEDFLFFVPRSLQ